MTGGGIVEGEGFYVQPTVIADAMQVEPLRAALFAGAVVNSSEGRAAEHPAQRGIGKDASVEEAARFHERMRALVEAIHEGVLGEVKSLIHIGIGGSALGPALAIDALARPKSQMGDAKVAVHVVSNIDGCALEAAFALCDPATTLIAVASKTFTTTETMTNAQSALDWLAQGDVADPGGRVIALTAAPDHAVEWGVDETRVLPFQESVGGRYSLWSSIGFPVALALGWAGFAEFLDGAAAIAPSPVNNSASWRVCIAMPPAGGGSGETKAKLRRQPLNGVACAELTLQPGPRGVMCSTSCAVCS